MTRWRKRFVLLVCAVALHSALIARAQADINPRAREDLDAFVKKVEEGDTLFNQKKYAEAAAALAAVHELYQRAERRDDGASRLEITLKPQTLPSLRYYGYIRGPQGSLGGEMADPIKENYARLHGAANDMWQDASILGNADKVPLTGALSDPPLVELTEEQLDSIVETLYDKVKRFELPVRDDEWLDVVLAGRRAQLILEHALQKYPAWRSGQRNWIGQPTGDEVLAKIKATLAEAEPEYQKLVADFKKAEPRGVAEAMRDEVDALNKAIAGVKRHGWLDWVMARDLYITKDYLAERRPRIVHPYTAEGKTMPADKLKPLEDKIAELKSTVEKNAPRWRFPTGKPHNAAIEARVKNGIKAKFPGATILQTALDGTDWTIRKNEFGLPRYRTRDVLVLVKIPGQKWPWLIRGEFDQTYAGGGTYNAGGTFAPPYSEVRLQTAN